MTFRGNPTVKDVKIDLGLGGGGGGGDLSQNTHPKKVLFK